MEKQSMTALVSAFARAYHAENTESPVFRDTAAKRLLGGEYAQLCAEWTKGRVVFAPDFSGTDAQALCLVVNRVLAGAPLARSAFAEALLEDAVRRGASQYVLLGAGYDTFAYRRPAWAARLSVWELDRAETLADKQRRLRQAGLPIDTRTHFAVADLSGAWAEKLRALPDFDPEAFSVCSLLGLSYYLTEDEFAALLAALHELLPHARIVFDYPQAVDKTNAAASLAAAAGETMRGGAAPQKMQAQLRACGWQVHTMLNAGEIERRYFAAYNARHPETPLTLMQRIGLCCAENG